MKQNNIEKTRKALINIFAITMVSRPLMEVCLNLFPHQFFFKPGAGIHSVLIILCCLSALFYICIETPPKELLILKKISLLFAGVSLIVFLRANNVGDFKEAVSYWVRLNLWTLPIPALAIALKKDSQNIVYKSTLIAAGIGIFMVLADTIFSGGHQCPVHNIREVGGTLFTTHHHSAFYYMFIPYVLLIPHVFGKKWEWLSLIAFVSLFFIVSLTFVRISILAMIIMVGFIFLLSFLKKKRRTPILVTTITILVLIFTAMIIKRQSLTERLKDVSVLKSFYHIILKPDAIFPGLAQNFEVHKKGAGTLEKIRIALDHRRTLWHLYIKEGSWKGLGSGRLGFLVYYSKAFFSVENSSNWLFGMGLKKAKTESGYHDHTPHNYMLHLMIELGFVGLIIFLVFWWFVFRQTLSLYPTNNVATFGLALLPAFVVISLISFPRLIPQQALYGAGFIGLALSNPSFRRKK